jgi:hypothetical protein
MDFGFEILLPAEAKINRLDFRIPTREWDGHFYPQGQEEAIFDQFKLVRREVQEHFADLLPTGFNTRLWRGIAIKEGFGQLIVEAWSAKTGLEESSSLFELINLIIEGRSEWVLIIEPEYDQAIEILNGDISLVQKRIIELSEGNTDGFMIWCSTGHGAKTCAEMV